MAEHRALPDFGSVNASDGELAIGEFKKAVRVKAAGRSDQTFRSEVDPETPTRQSRRKREIVANRATPGFQPAHLFKAIAAQSCATAPAKNYFGGRRARKLRSEHSRRQPSALQKPPLSGMSQRNVVTAPRVGVGERRNQPGKPAARRAAIWRSAKNQNVEFRCRSALYGDAQIIYFLFPQSRARPAVMM